jgi:O-antigen ligase
MISEQARQRWFVAVLSATFLFGIGPSAIQSFTANKYQTAIGQQTVAVSGPAGVVLRLAPLLLIGVCLAVIVVTVRNTERAGLGRLLALVAPWFWLVVHDSSIGVSFHRSELCYPLVAVAIWCLQPRIASLRWLGYVVGGVAVLSVLMGYLLPLKGLYQAADGLEITPDKQIFASGILVGPLASGNNLGQFLVMGLPAVFLIPRRGWRWALVAVTLYASLWAASRSCLIATAALLLAALLFRMMARSAWPTLTVIGLSAMAFVVVIVPSTATSVTSYSNRGYVWQVSKQAWSADRWSGLGSDYYGRIAATSGNLGGSVFHGHNQYIHDLVTGGYVLALLMGLTIATAIVCAARLARRGFTYPTLFLIGFLGACIFEVSYSMVDRFFAMPVMLIPLSVIFFTSDLAQTTAPEDREGEDTPPAPPPEPAVRARALSPTHPLAPVVVRRVGGVERRRGVQSPPASTMSAEGQVGPGQSRNL